jgi:hypothetical protein
MDTHANQQNKSRHLILSVLSGVGITILFLVIGTILDYIVVQILSQYFLSDCFEDCYFAYFNAIFFVIALLSLIAGITSGFRTYKRRSEGS